MFVTVRGISAGWGVAACLGAGLLLSRGASQPREIVESVLAQARVEATEDRWATVMEPAVEAELLGTAHRFELLRVDCRTSMCIASMSWATHADAVADVAQLLRRDDPLGCERFIAEPAPAECDDGCITSLVLACAGVARPGTM